MVNTSPSRSKEDQSTNPTVNPYRPASRCFLWVLPAFRLAIPTVQPMGSPLQRLLQSVGWVKKQGSHYSHHVDTLGSAKLVTASTNFPATHQQNMGKVHLWGGAQWLSFSGISLVRPLLHAALLEKEEVASQANKCSRNGKTKKTHEKQTNKKTHNRKKNPSILHWIIHKIKQSQPCIRNY